MWLPVTPWQSRSERRVGSVGMLRAASRSRGLGMRAASRSLALSSVFARGMAISVGDAFPKGVNVQALPSRRRPAACDHTALQVQTSACLPAA